MRNRTCQHLDLGLPASRLGEHDFLLFKPPSLGALGAAAQADPLLTQAP